MSANLEERLRRAMREDAERTPASPVPPPDLRHRVRRRTAFTAGLSVATVVLVAASAVVGVRATGGGPPQPPAGAATCSTWSEVQAPTADPTRFDTYLRSVTAPSPDEALAVGIHRMPGEGGDSFLELQRWDGTAWSTLPAPEPPDYGEGPTLLSVAAAGPGEAWAVGMTNVERGGIPLALHWDGRDWLLSAVDPADEPESHLFGVAAFASDDVWAVGGWARPGQLQGGGLVTHWDGARWWTTALRTTSRPLDEPGGPYDILNAVAGSSGADVWAVGIQVNVPETFRRTLIERWDGSSWDRVASPNVEPPPGAGNVDDSLEAVTAIGPDDAWAVGSYEELGLRLDAPSTSRPLALHWDGSAWTVVPLPDVGSGGLTGVAATGPDDVWAVGSAYDEPGSPGWPLLMHWDGSAWSEATASLPAQGGLQAVTVIPGGGLWAVGTQGPGSPATTLVLRCS